MTLVGLTHQNIHEVFYRIFLSTAFQFDGTPKVLVINFKGDMTASAVLKLREEVTAVIYAANVSRGDRVICRVSSPGGTVSGYGLAAAQLERLKVTLVIIS